MVDRGRTPVRERPAAGLLDRVVEVLTGTGRRREVVCPTCGTANDAAVARWCGHCGERLAVHEVQTTERERSVDLTRVRTIVAPVFVAVVVLALLVPAAMRGSSGRVFGQSARGDEGRSGVVAGTAPDAPREVAWEASLGDLSNELPTVRLQPGRELGVLVADERLEVLDLATGRVRRTVDLRAAELFLEGGRVVDDLLLVPVNNDAGLTALDLATGTPRWAIDFATSSRLAAPEARPVPVAEGQQPGQRDVLTVGGVSAITRLDAASGEPRWSTDLAARIASGVVELTAVTPGFAAAVTVSPPGAILQPGSAAVTGGVAVLDAATGRLAWNVPLVAQDALGPVVASGPTPTGEGWLLHPDSTRGPNTLAVVRELATGAERTAIQIPSPTGIALVGDVVVTASSTAGLTGHSARDGQELWSIEGSFVDVTGDTASGAVVATREDGRVLVVDRDGATVSILDDADVGAGQPQLTDGRLVVTSRSGEVSVRDLTGAPLWSRATAAPQVASVATDGELVVAGSQTTTLVLDGGSGEVLTSVQRSPSGAVVRRGISGSVAIDEGIAVASPLASDASGRGLVGLVARTGIASWNRDGDPVPVVGPITRAVGLAWMPVGDEVHGYDFTNGRVAFAASAGRLRGPVVVTDELVVAGAAEPCRPDVRCPESVIAIVRQRVAPDVPREVRWTSDLPACGPVAVRDGRVLVPTTAGPVALSLDDGTTSWEVATTPSCRPLAIGSRVAVQAAGTTLRAWDVQDGSLAWSVDLDQTLASDPVLAGDEVVVATTSGDLLSVGLASGELRWQYRLPAPALTDPIVVDGRWVVLLRDGRVVGLR